MFDSVLWTMLEPALGILAACLPTMRFSDAESHDHANFPEDNFLLYQLQEHRRKLERQA